jgi:hypothetical protein
LPGRQRGIIGPLSKSFCAGRDNIFNLGCYLHTAGVVCHLPGKGSFKLKKDPIVDQIGWWFIVTSVANIAWIFAWHYERIFLSLLIMLVLLASLLKIYLGLGIGETAVSGAKKYLVHLPFSIYLGWITVATIANVTALLVAVEWNRFGLSEVFWTALVIIVATAITLPC